ncbi:MAG: type II toxin-antitoxin system VapC family toxin [Deltaproteobacteria bacterium]|nr:type II toxin-antitoxin system VapC family toxin [Deltaproteobacteria bacterium]
MKLLLDTCTFLWIVAGSPDLSDKARHLFTDPSNEVYLSAASVWEIIVKNRIGKLPLPEPPHDFIHKWRLRHQIRSLAIDESSVMQLCHLPEYHKDPFDRILICQSIANKLIILTSDPLITKYPVRVEW